MKIPIQILRPLQWLAHIAPIALLATSCSRPAVRSTVDQAAPAPSSRQADLAATAAFDGDRAYALLKAQCDFGPRPMGTEAHQNTESFLYQQLKSVTDIATTQTWTEKVLHGPGAGRSYPMTNILGMVRGSEDRGKAVGSLHPRLLLCAHYDTRPIADEDQVAANRKQPILGANDGASGVAAVLELARVLSIARPRHTIELALWDAEDLGEFSYGARHFAQLSHTAAWRAWRPSGCILLDMIGDANLDITHEQTSMRRAPALWLRMQNAAAETGATTHFQGDTIDITDDHIPLLDAGIPTIDVIDFDYPYWHTLADTPDKCSAASLKTVGDVMLQLIRDNGTGV